MILLPPFTRRILAITSFVILLTSISFAQAPKDLHAPWQNLLKLYVKEGKVNYTAWRKDRQTLSAYLTALNSVDSKTLKAWTIKDQLAFYINAYNAYTVEVILNYPNIKSIRDIEPNAWKQNMVKVHQKTMSLDDLENSIIRPTFKDPRIHFGIVCASISCPPLLVTTYTSENVDSLLDLNTKAYLKDGAQNYFTGNYTELSKIFEWFPDDFAKYPGGLTAFLKKYAPSTYDPKKSIRYKEYDWGLNQ